MQGKMLMSAGHSVPDLIYICSGVAERIYFLNSIKRMLQIIFLETICNDRQIIERNIRLKIQQSPDYSEEYAYFFFKKSLFFIKNFCLHDE